MLAEMLGGPKAVEGFRNRFDRDEKHLQTEIASSGWILAHKTGNSSAWKGVTAATNDVGILTAPDGGRRGVPPANSIFRPDLHII